jgi:hypothetical protein
MLRVSSLVVIGSRRTDLAVLGQQLRGVVRDSGLAAPLPGAVVTLRRLGRRVARRVISDGAGRFASPFSRAPRGCGRCGSDIVRAIWR